MARYTEAVCRLCRRSGEKLFLKGARCYSSKCGMDRRPKPPGQIIGRRRRLSDRGIQLREKQKARYVYGMLERQFLKFFKKAERQPGVTGDNLVVLLERRLDNVVYRLGFADSRPQARQLVMHGLFALNGRKTDIPSALVKEGDTIAFTEKGAKTAHYQMIKEAIGSKVIAGWFTLDSANLIGTVSALPTPESAETTFSGQVVVEYYSR